MATQEISLNSEGNPIIGNIFFPDRINPDKVPALCICHGIPSGNPPDPQDPGYPYLAQYLSALGLIVVIFNFRGTGLSGGNFDILGWTRDLSTIINFLCSKNEIREDKIFLMGFSGGAAVSIYYAAQDPRISYLITCASPAEFTFCHHPQQIQVFLEHCRTIGIIRDRDFPPSLETWADGFKTISPKDWIKKISPRPLLIIHGEEDDLVKVDHAKILYAHALEPKELSILKGAGHRLRLVKEAMSLAKAWIQKHL
jgi:fermentation-respiration switch protein FrsA (DUF1100 family)